MTIRPRRSVLYMPGANERALEKARSLPVDSIILDLEDSVAPDAKPEARARVAAAVKSGAYGGRELVIRINGLDTPWGVDDLKAAAAAGPHAVLVPKVARPGDIVNAARIFAARSWDCSLPTRTNWTCAIPTRPSASVPGAGSTSWAI